MISLIFTICELVVRAIISFFKLVYKVIVICGCFVYDAFKDLNGLEWKNSNDRPRIFKDYAIILGGLAIIVFVIWLVYTIFTGGSHSRSSYNYPVTTKQNTTIAQTTKTNTLQKVEPEIVKEEIQSAAIETTTQRIIETNAVTTETTKATIQQTFAQETIKINETTLQESTVNEEYINDNFYISGNSDTYSETFDIEEDYPSKAIIVIPKIGGKDAAKVAIANEFMEAAKEDLIGEAENILSEESPAYKTLNIIKNEVSSQSASRLRITMSGTLKTNSGASTNIKYVFTYDVENDDYELERKE